jgi:hypothetical protein
MYLKLFQKFFKILSEINETKQEYTDYIKLLDERIQQFSNETGETSVAVVEALQEELEEVKNDYKNYLNTVEEFTNVSENLNITVQDDQTNKSYTVVVPTGAMAAKGEESGGEGAEGDDFGTEVGMTSLKAPDGTGGGGGSSDAITFDDDQSELLSDQPSDDQDEVDMGADDVEAYADKIDAETELEKGKEGGEGEGELENGGNQGTTELDLKAPEDGKAGSGKTPENGENPEDIENPEEKPKNKEEDEGVGAPNKNLERTNFNKDKAPNDLEASKKVKKVFLKRPKKV